MRAKQHVLVVVDGTEVPGLLLKWGQTGERALVTYEVDGRVATQWVPSDELLPTPDSPHAEPVPD